jgi:hypothetical protein
MRNGDVRASLAACGVFVGVPAGLGAIWLARVAPPVPGCFTERSPGRDALVAEWFAGIGPIVGAGALVVVAAIVAVSRLRSAPDGWPRRAGARTAWIAALLATYSVACAVDRDLFVVASITWALVFLVFWPITTPALALVTGLWIRRQPAGRRSLAAVQALGWWSLLVGVLGVAMAVALRDTAPLCLD